MISDNKLNFPEYEEKIEKSMKQSGLNEAVVTGIGEIDGAQRPPSPSWTPIS